MKRSNYPITLICGLCLLAGGCLIKSARAPTRHFILSPLPPPEHALAAAQPPAIEVGFVKMPSYLLQDSMVIRKSATEIDVFQDALWAEPLDEGFRRVLEDDLSSLPDSRHVSLSLSEPVAVRVTVQRFDVDTQGRGTLIASWQLTHPGSEKPVKSGLAHLTRPGPSPLANPQAIATTLSALISEFSRELPAVPREATASKP